MFAKDIFVRFVGDDYIPSLIVSNPNLSYLI